MEISASFSKRMYDGYVEIEWKYEPTVMVLVGTFETYELALRGANEIAEIIKKIRIIYPDIQIKEVHHGAIANNINQLGDEDAILRDLGLDVDDELQDWREEIGYASPPALPVDSDPTYVRTLEDDLFAQDHDVRTSHRD